MDSNQPLKRHGKPEDVAQSVLFLMYRSGSTDYRRGVARRRGSLHRRPVNHLQEILAARAAALAL